uniref:Phospholipid/glycerol acyltransferase domain-containing protein n=1 Tax=Athene cunicularia TaxID=194338 RepID=A0A663NAX3_ATHCN
MRRDPLGGCTAEGRQPLGFRAALWGHFPQFFFFLVQAVSCSLLCCLGGETEAGKGGLSNVSVVVWGQPWPLAGLLTGLFSCRLCNWALLKLLNCLFLNVQLHRGQLEMVLRARKTPDVPLVFLSTHKSPLDGLLLSFLLFSQGLGVPRVTVGGQACSSRLRALLSRLGGIFLPLRMGQMPSKQDEGLPGAVLAVVSPAWGVRRGRQESGLQPSACPHRGKAPPGICWVIPLGMPAAASSPCGARGRGLFPRWLTIASPSLADGVSCSAVMAVAITSVLLLHKHREVRHGDFAWLLEKILLGQHDVGFSGQLCVLVQHSLILLKAHITCYHLSPIGDIAVVPKASAEALSVLSHHSAAILPVLAHEAVGGEERGVGDWGHQGLGTWGKSGTPFSRQPVPSAPCWFHQSLPSPRLFLQLSEPQGSPGFLLFLWRLLSPVLRTYTRAVAFLGRPSWPQTGRPPPQRGQLLLQPH